MSITLFGLWMHDVNEQLHTMGVRTADIQVDTNKPSVTMIHMSRFAKGILRFSCTRELEFELYDKRTNQLLKWSMISNANPTQPQTLLDFLQPYFTGLQTGEVQSFESLMQQL